MLSLHSKFSRFLVLAVLLAVSSVARAQVVTESFMNSTASGWTFSGTGYTPNLTSGGADASGNGWLRLTDTGGYEATSAYYNTAFTAAGATVYAKFDYESYGGSGADGITFFLFDGSVPFSVGANGGSIGYAQKTAAGGGGSNINGMNGGYLGVALDEYGNFSSASEGRVGGLNGTTGTVPDSIAVRGPGQGLNGYAYLGGSGTLAQSIDSASRPTQTNTVQILLTATNQLTVTLQQGGSSPQTVLQMDLSGYLRPDTLKFGFASGTGGSTNIHDVRNFSISALTSNLWSGGGSDGLWATNSNWDPTVVPTTGADILFDNTYVTSAQTVNTGANRNVRSISFDAPFNYTLNNNTVTFDNQGVTGFSGIAVTQTHGSAIDTINSNISINNAINIRNNASGTLNLTGAVATNGNTLTLDGTGAATNLSGVVSGTGALIKNDTGTATLSGANTYSGGTTINNGTLNANRSNALGTGSVTLAGGTLASTNSSTIANTISLTGDAALSNITSTGTLTQTGGSQTLVMNNATQGAINLSNTNTGRTLTVEVDSGTSIINGVIANGGTGAGGVTKAGAGILTLSGANTYTGTTTINDGTVQLGASNRLADTSSVTIGSSGTLNLNGFSEKVGTLTANAGATLDFGTPGGANTFVFGTYVAPSSGVFVVKNWESGTDTLATSVASQSVGSIYISGYGVAQEAASKTDNIYGTGANGAYLLTPVSIVQKEWDGSSSNTWGTAANWTTPNAPGTTEVALFNSLGVGQSNPVLAADTTIAGIKFGTGASVSYNLTSSGGGAAGRTLTLSGTVPYIQQQSSNSQTIAIANLALGNSTVADITGAGNLTISSKISGTANLIRDGSGAGKLILSGDNSGLSGSVYANSGVVQAANTNALGTGTTNILSGATLELAGGISPTNAIAVSGNGASSAGAIHNVSGTNTASGIVTLGGDTRIAADSGSTLNLTGNVTGSGQNLEVTGAGTVGFSQITTGTGNVTIDSTGTVNYTGGSTANTYAGATTVNSGTLNLAKNGGVNAVAGDLTINSGGTVKLSANNQISDSSAVTLNGIGTLNLNGQTETLGQLTSTSSTAVVSLGAGSLTLSGPNNTNSNYAGTLTGTAASSLNVGGTGKVYLSGNNSGFSGTTNVTNGTLNVSGSNSVLGTGSVNVSSSGNLQLQGGINLGNAIAINGTGTSGNGAIENFAGNNTISGAITLGGASRIQSDAGTLTASGTVALGANSLNVGGSGNTSIAGRISGTGGLTKDGSGDLHLGNNTNSFTGATTINAGSVIADASNVFNNAALMTIASGASLKLNGLSETIGALAGSGSVDFGSGGTLNLTSGSATFSGSFAGTGTVYIGSGATLTLGANFSNPNINIVLAGGTLNLNGTNDTFGNISITGNSVLDFGASTASVLNSTSLGFSNTSVTLTVNNWVNATDYFYTQNFTGATVNTRGTTPENQITFAGNSNNSTAWLGYDHQITPAPEPSTYGAIFTALALGAVGYRRFRRNRRDA